jgi:HlyD family secretion protein
MTANVRIVVEQRDDALMVPNAALRFRPAGEPEAQRSPRPGPAQNGRDAGRAGRVWVADGANARPLDVRLGLSDGLSTEVLAGPLAEGTEVIVGLAAGSQRDTGLPRLRLF